MPMDVTNRREILPVGSETQIRSFIIKRGRSLTPRLGAQSSINFISSVRRDLTMQPILMAITQVFMRQCWDRRWRVRTTLS